MWHWFIFTINHVKKLSEWIHDFPDKKYLWTLSVLSIKKKLIFFGQSQIIFFVMENNFVYGVHLHNLSIYGHNAWKRKRKSKKSCLLKKILFVLLFKEYYLRTKIINFWQHQFFFLNKICRTWCCQFKRFFGKKKSFLLINRTSV